jgi:prolipoprotein diacylglyceryltransferase
MFPTVQVGPLSLQVPGLVLLIGLWVGLSLSERRARSRGGNPAHLYNLVFVALIAGLLGARIFYAITYPQAFISNPLSLLSLNPGLLDPLAGASIAAISGMVYIYQKQISFWETLDALTPLFAVMGIAVGISHLSSGSAFGKPTDLPFGIELWGQVRHPSQVYETISAAFILAILWYLDKSSWSQVPGNTFLSFLALSAFSRLILEAFRGDSMLVGGGLRIAQIFAWIILAVCLSILSWRIYNIQVVKETG